jgi:hypothetical protein
MALFKILAWYLPTWDEENNNFSQDSRLQAKV